MVTVKIRTRDIQWAAKRGYTFEDEGHGDGFGLVTIQVPAVEHTTFCGRDMIRFDLGAKSPKDHPRWAMYPARYLVQTAN